MGTVAGSWLWLHHTSQHLQRAQLPLAAASLSPSSFSALLPKKVSAVRVLEACPPFPMRASCQAQDWSPSASPPLHPSWHNPFLGGTCCTYKDTDTEWGSAGRNLGSEKTSENSVKAPGLPSSRQLQPKSRARALHPCLSPQLHEDKPHWGLGQSSGPAWGFLQTHCQSQAGSSLPFPHQA